MTISKTLRLAILGLCLLGVASAAGKKKTPSKSPLDQYIDQMRTERTAQPASPGSLWRADSPLASPELDTRARIAGDPIIIRVVESTTASEDGSVKGSRDFKASSSISAAGGTLSKTNRLQDIFSPTSHSELTGQAQTSSNSLLQTSLSGYVKEVLPNGMMVIQADRIINMNQQKQLMTVRGIVRPTDVAGDNSVNSTLVTALEVQLEGKGVISDYTRRPNIVIRTILRLLNF